VGTERSPRCRRLRYIFWRCEDRSYLAPWIVSVTCLTEEKCQLRDVPADRPVPSSLRAKPFPIARPSPTGHSRFNRRAQGSQVTLEGLATRRAQRIHSKRCEHRMAQPEGGVATTGGSVRRT
jgi:hypothetical protein